MSRIVRTFRTWSGGGLYAGLLAGLVALALAPASTSAQSLEVKKQMLRDRLSHFNLAAGPDVYLNVNELQCGATSEGELCVDTFGSPTGGGGFWPGGSPNQYMFSSGLQVMGIITAPTGCTRENRNNAPVPGCFAWSGDTTAALFFEGTGVRHHGVPVTPMYSSLDPADLAIWPQPGSVPDFPEATSMILNDTALFNDVLIGLPAASQQDSWVAYWDGDPNKSGGRTHPMGILAEQRTLAWNYPAGNENVIYAIYKLTNITNNALFQRVNENRYFGGLDSLPNAGWTFDSVYVAFDSDPDVAQAGQNHASGILPFNLALAYMATYQDNSFIFPPDIFHPPFFERAVGIWAHKYLKSPVDPATGEEIGLTLLSLHTNGGAFRDPANVQQAWRYVSLNVDPTKGDQNCTIPLAQIKQARSCYLGQTPFDVRVFMGSGPFSLAPGQSATIAVANYAAATVETPLITLGQDNKPGIPTIAPGCFGQPIRPLEIASGWLQTLTCPEPGEVLSQQDVRVVPNSLLGRALVAQSIFDNKFLLGFAPDAPNFYLVPGDDQITVIWEPSATEQAGDPFFAAAGDEDNALFDPNYREFDVEGYRIYRGTSPADMDLIAQFDKDGSVFTDFTCATDPTHVTGNPCNDVHEVELVGNFVQVRTVAELASGDPILLDADTALSTEIAAGTSQPLSDTGIPFAYVDNQVRNGFQYFYKVTAFDINSLKSGPSSLESAAPTKSASPVSTGPNLTLASFNTFLAGADGEALNPNAPLPSIDPQDGTFSGPMPPTNGIEGTFAPLVERLLPQVTLSVTIDSVVPGFTPAQCPEGRATTIPTCWQMYLTVDKDGQQTQVVQHGFTPTWGAFGGANLTEYTLAQASVEADATAAAQFGIPAGASSFNAAVVAQFPETIAMSGHLGQAISRGGNTSGNSLASPIPSSTSLAAGGSRWFVGTESTTPDPARLDRVGHIPGIDTIWSPESPNLAGTPFRLGTNNACFTYNIMQMARAADVEFRWSGSGAEVWDVTHDVPVIFKPTTQASYGFLTTDANGNGVVDYDDFNYIEGIFDASVTCGRVAGRPAVQLSQTPSLVPISTGAAAIGSLTSTGTGFGIYVNGERFIVQTGAMPSSDTWTLRTYQGWVTASSGGNTENPSGYAFTDRGLIRPPMIPGLQVVFEVEKASTVAEGAVDLERIHTVPDPYYATSLFDLGPANKELQFVNMPPKATIRIYSMSGVLVDIINHESAGASAVAKWDLRNRSNQFVASGVYYFHVSTADGDSHVGKFTVVNSGLGS